nr:reverse transcriptase domain-containing protein [Tanacetum cinerariifolium]
MDYESRTSVPAAETTFVSSPSVGRTKTTGIADHCSPYDRTEDGTDVSLLYKPCVTGSGTKLLPDGKAGIITGLCSKKASKIFSGTSYREHNVTYRPKTSIKGQILADFLNEMPSNASQGASVAETQEEPWTLFTDGSSCVDGSGAGLILTNSDGVEFTYALRFQFAASNNEVEYEALIDGLRITTQMGVKNIQTNVDSKLVANQVLGTYIAKEDNMIKYLDIAKDLVSGFKTFSICQVSRSNNKKADALSKIASTSFAHLSKQVLVEVLETKSITAKEVTAVIEEEGTPPHNKTSPTTSDPNHGFVAVLQVGNRHSRPFSRRAEEGQVPDSRNGLLHEVDRSKSSGNDYRRTSEEILIPAEIGMPTYRTTVVDVVNNDEELCLNLDLLEERQELAAMSEAGSKSKMMKYYNSRVRGVAFKPGDFVYRSNDASHAVAGGKLGPKWEGPYEVTYALGNGAYKLRSMDGTMLPRT